MEDLNATLRAVYEPLVKSMVEGMQRYDRMMDRAEQQHSGLDDAAWAAHKRDRSIRYAWDRMEEQDAYEWVWTYMPATLRPLAELHDNDGGSCKGCDPGSYAESDAYWPCKTWQMIEQQVAGA